MRLFITLICIIFSLPAFSQVMEGGVSKNGAFNQVFDSQTNLPISNAKISIPKQNYTTYTDNNGTFNINARIDDTSIMSIEKDGYRPFSITINDKIASHPMVIGIEKSNVQDIVIATEMFHLGDDNFSQASANSSEFKSNSIGPSYSKKFEISNEARNKKNYLVIGSIIGIDTLLARSMNQNKIVNSYSTAPEVFFNGQKIAEIQLNGDNQKIRLPNNLIRTGLNEVSIKTGKNALQTSYIDYDDIELMNLFVQSE